MPNFLAVSLAMASASPVTILTFTPICQRGRDGCLGIFPRRIEQGQHAQETAIGRRPRPAPRPSERKPRAANSLTAFSTAGFTCPALADNAKITCGAPFVTLNVFPSLAFDGGFGAFMHRIKGLEMDHLITFQRLFVFQSAQNGQINGVVIVRARRQRGIEDDLFGRDIVHAERIAQRQLVLGQGAGLVRAQHIHARQFLDGHQPAHNRLFFGEQARADRHRHGQHRRHRHGNRGHGQHKGKLQRGEDRVAAEKLRSQ